MPYTMPYTIYIVVNIIIFLKKVIESELVPKANSFPYVQKYDDKIYQSCRIFDFLNWAKQAF